MGAPAGGYDSPRGGSHPPDRAIAYIAGTISRLERGESVSGQVDRQRGY